MGHSKASKNMQQRNLEKCDLWQIIYDYGDGSLAKFNFHFNRGKFSNFSHHQPEHLLNKLQDLR